MIGPATATMTSVADAVKAKAQDKSATAAPDLVGQLNIVELPMFIRVCSQFVALNVPRAQSDVRVVEVVPPSWTSSRGDYVYNLTLRAVQAL
ncbi:hypothetical protein AC629_36970 [Bradyrhizobium sp. NAS80.1]|nr:hypothetical protein AC629_36970 [Bradyrhizobium sp. NAS80.1]OKO80498.1 hypothetical protein AC630_15595 [Bradyrhizobium sp. AS23.2]